MKLTIEIYDNYSWLCADKNEERSLRDEFRMKSYLSGSSSCGEAPDTEECRLYDRYMPNDAQAVEVARLLELNAKIYQLVEDYASSSSPFDVRISMNSSKEQ